MRTMPFTFATLLTIAGGTALTSAAELKAGDSLTYTMTSNTKISGGNLPAQAYKPQPNVVRTITLTVTAVDPSGAAQVHVKQHKAPPPGMLAWQAAAFEKQANGEFDATLTPYGAVLATVDDSYQSQQASAPTKGMSLAQVRDQVVAQVDDPAYQGNEAARDVKGDFAAGNAVALVAPKRKSFAAGDAWKTVIDGANYDVKVIGKTSFDGHDTVQLAVTNASQFQAGSATSEATVYYDQASRRIIGIHTVRHSHINITGMDTTATSDLVLKE